jgi:hypothetical protein
MSRLSKQLTRSPNFLTSEQNLEIIDDALELADLAAEGRLFDSEPFGCAGEMQLLGNRYEIAEIPELHGPTTGVDRLGTLRRHRKKPALVIPHFTTVSSGWSGAGTTLAIASEIA